MSIAVRRSGSIDARRAMAASRTALDGPLADEAELWVGAVTGDAIALGAFQRGAELEATADAALGAHMLAGGRARRGSGGPAVRVGAGTLHVLLLLPHPAQLVPCDASRLVNRYVRPLLRALTKVGATAHWFGRDWISVKHRPAAWVGFAHDATTQRSVIEALIAVRTPFALPSRVPRASYLGKEPGTLETIANVPVDMNVLADGIVAAYAGAYGRTAIDAGDWPDPARVDEDAQRDPPWRATSDEAIGLLGAGPDHAGRMRVGGALMVSRDALDRLEKSLETIPRGASREELAEDVARRVDGALAAPGVVIEGVRSLASVRDVITRALANDEPL